MRAVFTDIVKGAQHPRLIPHNSDRFACDLGGDVGPSLFDFLTVTDPLPSLGEDQLLIGFKPFLGLYRPLPLRKGRQQDWNQNLGEYG